MGDGGVNAVVFGGVHVDDLGADVGEQVVEGGEGLGVLGGVGADNPFFATK